MIELQVIGHIESALRDPAHAPKQGSEGAPDAWLEVLPGFADALEGISVGDEVVVVTWLHRARRDLLKVHPRDDTNAPLKGVFATRSADRPNPLGLHAVRVSQMDNLRLRVGPIEAVDGTPVVDIKPAM